MLDDVRTEASAAQRALRMPAATWMSDCGASLGTSISDGRCVREAFLSAAGTTTTCSEVDAAGCSASCTPKSTTSTTGRGGRVETVALPSPKETWDAKQDVKQDAKQDAQRDAEQDAKTTEGQGAMPSGGREALLKEGHGAEPTEGHDAKLTDGRDAAPLTATQDARPPPSPPAGREGVEGRARLREAVAARACCAAVLAALFAMLTLPVARQPLPIPLLRNFDEAWAWYGRHPGGAMSAMGINGPQDALAASRRHHRGETRRPAPGLRCREPQGLQRNGSARPACARARQHHLSAADVAVCQRPGERRIERGRKERALLAPPWVTT